MKKNSFIAICLLLSCGLMFGQKSKQLENVMRELSVSYEKNNQENILQLVHQIYTIDTILPDDAAFFLGYTLYKFEQYRASKVALLRYIQLTKESGNHFDTTKFFINCIDEKLNQYDTNYCDICNTLGPLAEMDTCKTCLGVGKNLQKCHQCNGHGKEVCPRCLGVGYEHFQDNFQSNFYPCRVCNRAGTITCNNCKGSGKEINLCKTCSGVGETNRIRICTHRDLESATITPVLKTKTTTFYR